MQSRRYDWFPGIHQVLAKSDPPVALKNGYPFSYTNGQNRVRSTQLCRVISPEPLRVKRRMSPVWKGDNQGYNIVGNKKK